MIYKIVECELGTYPEIKSVELELSAKAFPKFVQRLESFSEMDVDHFTTKINNINVNFIKSKRPYSKLAFFADTFSIPHRKIIDDKDVA
jgi:hypothetical protein